MSPANIAASVKARLQNKAKETGKVYNEVLQLYAMERFLYRLSKSDYADKFVLKGALLFMVWKPEYQRRTPKIFPNLPINKYNGPPLFESKA